MIALHFAIPLFFPAGMAFAASMDLLTMTIPNRLCLALAFGYVVIATFFGVAPRDVATNLSCGAVILGLAFGLFSVGWIGGGDAKLAAATAVWLGWGLMPKFGLTSAVYGGVLTLTILLGRYIYLPTWLARQGWIARLREPTTGVPYGIALAAAGLLAYPQSEIWQRLATG